MIKLMYPTRFIGISAYFHDEAYKKKFGSVHNGIDLYRDEDKDIPICSAGVGTVALVHDNDTTKKSWGNYVKINHGDNMYTLYGHLKQGIKVKIGDTVDTNTVLGIMGTTGNSTGIHLHYEVYLGGASTSYRVNPIDYTYANHTDYRFSIYPEKYKGVKFIEDAVDVIPAVKRDENKDQVKVLVNALSVRKEPSTSGVKIGTAVKGGIYNFYEVKDNEGYTWYRIADSQWVANNGKYLEVHNKMATQPETQSATEKQIQELQDELKKANALNDSYQVEIKELKKSETYKFKYTVKESGTYKKSLQVGDTLIIK